MGLLVKDRLTNDNIVARILNNHVYFDGSSRIAINTVCDTQRNGYGMSC